VQPYAKPGGVKGNFCWINFNNKKLHTTPGVGLGVLLGVKRIINGGTGKKRPVEGANWATHCLARVDHALNQEKKRRGKNIADEVSWCVGKTTVNKLCKNEDGALKRIVQQIVEERGQIFHKIGPDLIKKRLLLPFGSRTVINWAKIHPSNC